MQGSRSNRWLALGLSDRDRGARDRHLRVDRVRVQADAVPHGARRAVPLRPEHLNDHLIVRSLRDAPHGRRVCWSAPRSGSSGAVMQGVTRNPLADPGHPRRRGRRRARSWSSAIYTLRRGDVARLRVVRVRRRGGRVGGRLRARLARPRGRDAGEAGARRRGDHRVPRFDHHRDPAARRRHARPVPLLGGRLARRARRPTIAARWLPFIVGRRRAGARARHGRSTRWRSATTSPARSASGSAWPGCSRPVAVVLLVRRGDRGRRADRVRRPRRCRTSPGRSPVPTTAGSCRTRWCWRRSCCSAPTSSAGSIARPGEVQVGIVTALDRRAVLHRARAPPQAGGAVSDASPSLRLAGRASARRRPSTGRPSRPARPASITVRCVLAVDRVRRLLRRHQRRRLPDPARRGACRRSSATATATRDFIVHTLRLPRALTALLVGAAFGLSGAIFQTLARNPLASPDIIGITAGARRPRPCS